MKDQIADYIGKTFLYGERTVGEGEQLFESGVLDSLGFIKLLSFLEKTYNIRIEMSEITMDKFSTVANIAEVVAAKREAAEAGA